MNKSIFTQKIFAGIAALFCVLLLASCWENFSNELMDYNDSTPPEVELTGATVTSSNITLNWNDPSPVTYSAVIINCTDGTTTTEQTVQRGTMNVNIPFTGTAERTITLTAIYSTGPRSKASVFKAKPDGTALNFIYTPAQLYNVSSNLGYYYIVMNDLDLSDYSSGTGWSPIGVDGTPFTGTFDGNGYTISNLTINNPDADYQGLFGTVTNATIRNTHIAGCNITAKNYVGGLAGNIDCSNGSTCTISNCTVTGKVTSETVTTGIGFIGGFAGRINNDGSIAISHCITTVDVKVTTTSTGSYNIGGFAGRYASNEDPDSSIDYCMASGNVEVNTENPVEAGKVIRVGGFIGMDALDYANNYGKITNCIASGRVYYNGPGGCNVGGFVGLSETGAELSGCSSSGDVVIDQGYVDGTYAGGFTGFSHRNNKITGCSASGNVTGPRSIGGFAGLIGLNSGVIMENCHATGNVTGTFAEAMVGGFVGICNTNTTIRKCYATGNVSGKYAGGFSGYTGNTHNTETRVLTIINCYSTGHVSGTTYAAGFSGYTFCENPNVANLTVDIINCYSTGTVSGTAANKNGFGYYTTSGANTTINVTGCFFNSTTAGSVTDSSAAGRSTSAMKTQSTYTVWDFTTVWAIGSINSGYPYLKDNPPVN